MPNPEPSQPNHHPTQPYHYQNQPNPWVVHRTPPQGNSMSLSCEVTIAATQYIVVHSCSLDDQWTMIILRFQKNVFNSGIVKKSRVSTRGGVCPFCQIHLSRRDCHVKICKLKDMRNTEVEIEENNNIVMTHEADDTGLSQSSGIVGSTYQTATIPTTQSSSSHTKMSKNNKMSTAHPRLPLSFLQPRDSQDPNLWIDHLKVFLLISLIITY